MLLTNQVPDPEVLREAAVLLTNPEGLREATVLLANQLPDPGSLRVATVFLLTNQLPDPRDFTGGDSVSYPIEPPDPGVGCQLRLFRSRSSERLFLYENT